MSVVVRPLTPDRLEDYLGFFDRRAFTDNPGWAGCYCRFYHHDPARGKWEENTAEANREAARRAIAAGEMRGYLAWDGGAVVGWCNADRKERYPLLAADPDLDDGERRSVVSVVCFVVAPEHRGRGVATRLLEAVVGDCAERGIELLEAYPRRAASGSAAHYHGPPALYERAGFTVHRELATYRVVRRELRPRA